MIPATHLFVCRFEVSTQFRCKGYANTYPRLRETCSTGIHHTPKISNANLDSIAVNTYDKALYIGGMGICLL